MTNGNELAQRDAPVRQPVAMSKRGAVISSMEDLWRLANGVVRGGFAPKGLQTPEAVMAAMQMGMELGLSPMASLRGIAVINGRPSVWGDLAMALVHSSGQLEYIKEWTEGEGDKKIAYCEVKRVGRTFAVKRQFAVADAQRAGLWAKDIWRNYPDRMLQMRARGYAIRDEFADVLQGMYLAEEAQDIPDDQQQADNRPRTEQLLEKVQKALPESPAPQAPQQPVAADENSRDSAETTTTQGTTVIPDVSAAGGPADAEEDETHDTPPDPWHTYDSLVEALNALAVARGHTAKDVTNALKRGLLTLGKVGKGNETTLKWREEAYQAGLEGRGNFAFMAPTMAQELKERIKSKDVKPEFDAVGPQGSPI